MKTFLRVSFLMALSTFATAPASFAAAFQNGSFEQPPLSTPPGILLPSGSTNITGWVTGGSGQVSFVLGDASGINPADGSQQIDFNGGNTTTGATLRQTFDTVPGQTYAVGFRLGRAGPGGGTMSLVAEVTSNGGTNLGSLTATAPGSPGYGPAQTFSFTATTSTSTLIFTDTSSATTAVDLLLDNVFIVPGPPPQPLVTVITNGGFESPALPLGGTQVMSPGSTELTGWTIGGSGLLGLINGPALGVNPVEGLQHIGFNGGDLPPGTVIAQTFNTAIGQTYEVRFFVGRIGGEGPLSLLAEAASSVGAVLGSKSATAPDLPGYGSAQTFTFTAATSTSTLKFTDTSLATAGVDMLLDDVTVVPISSPPSVGPFVNGSFEQPALPAGSGQALPSGSTAITGWTVEGTGIGWQNGASFGVNPADGAQHIGFNGGNMSPGASISQTFSTTAGRSYTVQFQIGRTGTGDGTVSLLAEVTSITGTNLGSLAATAPGTPGYGSILTFTFTATTATSTLTFTDTSSATVAVDVLLDNVSVTPSTACVAPPSGLIGWWRGEGNADDAVGENVGTLAGGVAFADGKVGQAFGFDGTGEVRIDDAPALNVQQFTIDAWVYPTLLDGEMETILYKETENSSVKQYALAIKGATNVSCSGSIPTGHFAFAILGPNGLPSEFCGWTDGGGAVPLNQWTHVALAFDGTSAKAYVNGSLTRNITNLSGSVNTSAGPLKIGSRSQIIVNSFPRERFNGRIDEVDVFDRALSGNEIQAIYDAGSAGKCAPSQPEARAIAHWRFDETSGTIAHDSTGSFDGNLSSGGASFVAGGMSGNALSLSKTNNGFANMGNVLGLTSGDFSIVAWIKMTPGDITESSVIISKQEAGWANGYVLSANASISYSQPGKTWFSDSAFPGQEVNSTTTINDGHWHQIVAVYQAGAAKYIFVDGAPAEDSKASRAIVPNNGFFLIGGDTYSGIPTAQFTGLVDDVQIYNYALVSSEVDFVFHNPGQEIAPHDLPPGQWRLTTVASTGGTVTKDPDLSKYTNGATVTVTAAPNPGFAFTGWSGDATGTNNPITVTMTANKTVTASFAEIPARILAVVNPAPKQEGQKINFDLQLISQGDVGGMNFILRYNPDYLKDPKLDWSSSVGSALNQVNYDAPGEIRATFALPATAVPAGTQRVANVSFRARSVPFDLSTDLGLELVDVSAPTGDSIRSGNAARGGAAHILVRRIIGDNNANDRLDVGDATIMQRLLTGLNEVRSWDVGGNDVNANTSLDSGDVIRVLRVVADIDPQPTPQGATASTSRLSKSALGKAGPSSELAVLIADRLRGQPGDLVTVQVVLRDITSQIAGVSFALDYPTNALRLLNSQSHRTGALVPGSAVAIWNVQPAQNSYTLQNGRVSFGASSATQWPSSNGVLAEFTFQVQAGQTEQYRWPVRLSRVELTPDGYEIRDLAESEIYFIGRDPLPASLGTAGSGLSDTGFNFTVGGEIGVPYLIEVSTDLINWTPLTTQINTTGVLSVVDPDAPNHSQRFYRAKQQ
jgi:uncharacterized repeat protein (TIGR02543 family)